MPHKPGHLVDHLDSIHWGGPKFGVAKYVTMTYCICMKKNCNPMDQLRQFVVGKHPWCHHCLAFPDPYETQSSFATTARFSLHT